MCYNQRERKITSKSADAVAPCVDGRNGGVIAAAGSSVGGSYGFEGRIEKGKERNGFGDV